MPGNYHIALLSLDPHKPIMSTVQERQGIISLPSSFPSPAIVDVSENIRAKVFSLVSKLGMLRFTYLATQAIKT